MDSVTYYHVELPVHDVILAEGLACESYLDTGNRAAFANGGGAEMLHPDFARATWASAGCAPLVLEGDKLIAAREDLLRQAEALGHNRTRLPALRVEADGRVLPARIIGRHWQVALPTGTATVTLRSRTWIPAHTRANESDTRRLGVAVANIALDGRDIPLADARLAEGWHGAEAEWRWTDGAARLRVDDATSLAFDLALTGTYWEARRDDQAAHTAAAT